MLRKAALFGRKDISDMREQEKVSYLFCRELAL